jgi:peroxiredoxin Q/BCP
LRQDYQEFVRRGVEVVVVGPEGPDEFRRYWAAEKLPFVGLADPKHSVARRYRQEVSLLKLGRMPALFVVDGEGMIRFSHHAAWMSDIPENALVLEVLDELLAERSARANRESPTASG